MLPLVIPIYNSEQGLFAVGLRSSALSIVIGSIVLWARLRGSIQVAGYTPIVLMIMFFGGLTALGLGVVGQYLWLTLQNARAGGPASSFDLSSRIRLTNREKSKHKPNTSP